MQVLPVHSTNDSRCDFLRMWWLLHENKLLGMLVSPLPLQRPRDCTSEEVISGRCLGLETFLGTIFYQTIPSAIAFNRIIFDNMIPPCFQLKRLIYNLGLPRWHSGKESACQHRRCRFNSWVGKIPWSRKWQAMPVFLVWEIPWTEESGGLQSMGLQRVRHDWAAAAAKLLQLCPTLCDPIEGSPLGSSVPGILQARILEWVAIAFSTWLSMHTHIPFKINAKSECESVSRPVVSALCDPMDCVAHQALLSMEFFRQEYWSGLSFPPPGDLPNAGMEPQSPAMKADSLPSEPSGKPKINTKTKL